jgi:hypothetical protein
MTTSALDGDRLAIVRRYVQEAWALVGDPKQYGLACKKLEAADALLAFEQDARARAIRQQAEVPA